MSRIEAPSKAVSSSQWRRAWRTFKKNKLAIASLVVLLLIIGACIFAPLLTPHTSYEQNLNNRMQPPSREHWFGTDRLGRDVFSRLLYGGRTTLLMSVTAMAITAAIGGVIGMIAGYCGGKLDAVIMRVMDVFSAIPAMLMAIAVVAFIGIGAEKSMIAIAVAAIPAYVRLLRTVVLGVMASPYVEAARALGAGPLRIIFRHVIHNILAPMIVHITTGIADAILIFSSLGYLSLAVQPPNPEWGNMVVAGMSSYYTGWFTLVYPCGAIALTILALNMLGDGLRDALDPLMSRS